MKIIGKLNQILADSSVFYTKLHNYHWNINGNQFYAVHSKTESYYEAFAKVYDDLAERILQLGGKPLVTLSQILETARIKEEDKTSFDANYVVTNIKKDLEYFRDQFKELAQMSSDDKVTDAYATEQLTFLEKEIWMLKSFSS